MKGCCSTAPDEVLANLQAKRSEFVAFVSGRVRDASLAEDIVEAVRVVCPIETAELVDTWECRAGIIRPQVDPTERPQWAESVWLIVNKTAQSYTLETPSDFSLEPRVRAHLAAVRGALRSFLRK